ncbi:hypothetical protein [Solemya velum gill symbiont]|uniref:Hemerythrin-like domain-containing protein n=1 Tax=Solemya velum gill symbiont TaxID=2340 RepID=A0A0B0H8U1_SOVGS|nr:hypothetical protein [Solemya velum gill symbiont]KHF25510.1 hypothetical protein JV46_13270 [Solemya velum gill symbiont]OOY50002.1 hypothetical protein BOV97_12130 [Solemya velum gill symbiont]OOY54318.1 hypothetical protein BOV99_11535 [Solemya velum gill symbiont]OOY54606.1 hypothetical protein BOW00_11540 [Solemya velum gill symbiont]OOY59020.1 hypothetical protein BOW02_11430 [Solemya velum gill symbiont]
MITYDELHNQNHKITEHANILHYLLADRSLCDSKVTCDLFFHFVDMVKEHIEVTDKHFYKHLLVCDQETKNTATKFMSGSVEIKKVFSEYLSKWCNKRGKQLRISDYENFKSETDEVFNMVLDRIQAETENLYPLVKEVTGDLRAVA